MKKDFSFLNSDFYQGHRRPVSRRDFVSYGMAGLSGVMLGGMGWMTSVQQARADSAASSYIPFLTFDLAGGAGLPGNFLVGKSGGPEDLLTSYSTLGWNPRTSAGWDNRFGLPMAAGGVSQLLTGILSETSAEAQSRFRMGSLLHVSRDDTSANPLSIASMVLKAGLQGQKIRGGMGTRGSSSGGNSRLVVEDNLFKALEIRQLGDYSNAVGGGLVMDSLPKPMRDRLVGMVRSISGAHADKKLTRPDGGLLREVSENAYRSYYENMLSGAANVDPRVDPVVSAVYRLAANTDPTSEAVVSAIMVASALRGISGPSVITIPGCDYHDGTQTTGDAKDLQIGRAIGQAVELAHRLRKPLMIHILTDGGVYSREGSRFWQGDSGDRSMTVMGLYLPDRAPQYAVKERTQIGAYTDGQGVDRTTLIGASPSLGAYAALANYLSACGKLGQFSTLAPGVFAPAELESTLIFA